MNTKQVLEATGWTQEKFAEVCGLRQSTVSYRKNNNVMPSISEARLIADKSGLSFTKIINGVKP